MANSFLTRDQFYESARLYGEACLELFIYRITPSGEKQVYLLPRPADDPFYPLELHMPGARKIPCETDRDHLRRALKETPFKMAFVGVEYLMSTTIKAKRGTEYADIRGVLVLYDPQQADFYDVDNLPRKTMKHHRALINMVKGLK